jgi:hypothetical protein
MLALREERASRLSTEVSGDIQLSPRDVNQGMIGELSSETGGPRNMQSWSSPPKLKEVIALGKWIRESADMQRSALEIVERDGTQRRAVEGPAVDLIYSYSTDLEQVLTEIRPQAAKCLERARSLAGRTQDERSASNVASAPAPRGGDPTLRCSSLQGVSLTRFHDLRVDLQNQATELSRAWQARNRRADPISSPYRRLQSFLETYLHRFLQNAAPSGGLTLGNLQQLLEQNTALRSMLESEVLRARERGESSLREDLETLRGYLPTNAALEAQLAACRSPGGAGRTESPDAAGAPSARPAR